MPQPVYATGPQVKTDECQRIVTSLVTLQCMNANNCIDARIDDIRPAIILQLSRMSGGNYATACAGYLDGIFNDYVSQFANAAPKGISVGFPIPAAPNTNANSNQIQLNNPFATSAPDWATDMRERQLELQALHTETGTNNYHVQHADFPATYADVSFTDRLENARNGYEPFKDARAYREMDIEDEETYLERINKEKCTKKTCNIEYYLSGGVNNSRNPKKYTTCGRPITLQEPTLTKKYYTTKGRQISNFSLDFIAWYTDPNFASDKKITKIEDKHCKTDGGTIELYAKWSIGQPTADPDGTPPELLGNNENPNPLGDQNPQEGTGQEVTEDNKNQTPQEVPNPQEETEQEGPNTFEIPRTEQEDSEVPPISLEDKNPNSNLCYFANDGVRFYAPTPRTLEYVGKLINTNSNGNILLEAAAYAGCATQDGNPGGTYCWCAFDGREYNSEKNELEPKFLLICEDLAAGLRLNRTTSERCPEDCKQFCKNLLNPEQNQQ